MKKISERESKVEPTTGEVYFSFRKNYEPDKGKRLRRFEAWISRHINAHFDRMSSLRVYDKKRVK